MERKECDEDAETKENEKVDDWSGSEDTDLAKVLK